MKRFLIVVDMQNDFVSGSLGTKEAQAIVPGVVAKIDGFDGTVIATRDTHFEDYLNTAEGKKLPVEHCIKGTWGWQIEDSVAAALDRAGAGIIDKYTFGSTELPELIEKLAGGEEFSIQLLGLCTDICVVSNALLLKAFFREVPISYVPSCCAGVTPASHAAAQSVLACCQIDSAE